MNTMPAHSGPLRGNKGSTFEGGMREPTVIRWLGQIAAGSENDEPMPAMGLLPAFAKLAGAEVPSVVERLQAYARDFKEELLQNSRPTAFVYNPKLLKMGERW